MFCGKFSVHSFDDEYTVSRARPQNQRKSDEQETADQIATKPHVNNGYTGSNGDLQKPLQNGQVFHISSWHNKEFILKLSIDILAFWYCKFFDILSKLFSLHVTNYMGPYHDIFVKLSIKVT